MDKVDIYSRFFIGIVFNWVVIGMLAIIMWVFAVPFPVYSFMLIAFVFEFIIAIYRLVFKLNA